MWYKALPLSLHIETNGNAVTMNTERLNLWGEYFARILSIASNNTEFPSVSRQSRPMRSIPTHAPTTKERPTPGQLWGYLPIFLPFF